MENKVKSQWKYITFWKKM